MQKIKFVAIILAGIGLSACQTVQSNVTAFHTLSPVTMETFSVRPIGAQDSLEAATYASIISQKLVAHGWTEARQGNIEVTFGFGIDEGRTEVSSVPMYGQTGGGSTYSSGSVYTRGGYGTYSGTSYTPSSFGVVGSRIVSDTVYTRTLVVEMRNKSTGKKVFESRVTSAGSTGSVAAVAGCLIEALFEDFPGTSGKARLTELNSEKCTR